MLKNLDPLLTPELLYVLRAMGHGDVLTIVDSNFPADSVAATTVHGQLLRLDGADIPEAARAIFSVFPLDSFVDAPLQYMEVVGEPETILEVHTDLHKIALEYSDREWKMESVERHEFYAESRNTYAVLATSERRPYGCFMIKKGVLGPDGKVV
ncbi:MAG: L-fucose mutarotase [Deltaproteobacteria bacterium]|jgi:L-fucose mutarotase|nr:L-fucose mutarotase [Deltaproteobacteria bacterium]